ncbi:MAG TPA: hypothetical protein VN222_14605 [Novosphingobium sp.]|nr:hypothetical protein [Novosphingobium sp.]
MSIRFAAAGTGECSAVTRVVTCVRPATPANDCDNGISRDMLLQSTLRHFARHGLGAAEHARDEAERAFFAGDRRRYQHWLAICRMLDKQVASAVIAHGAEY